MACLAVTVLASALAWSNNVGPFSRENLVIRQIANHNSEIAKNPADDESRHLVQSANEIQDSVMMHYLVRDEESHTRVLAPKSTKSASKSSKSGSKSGKIEQVHLLSHLESWSNRESFYQSHR